MARSFAEAGLPLLSLVNEGFGREIPEDFYEKALRGPKFIASAER